MTSKQPNKRAVARRSESGNAFYIILIGVILFAALMYVFSKTVRQGTGNMGKKQSEMSADGIMDYAQALDRGVSRVMTNGCSENDINFVTPLIPTYPDNPDAPTDHSCNVFDTAGGAITAMAPASFGANVKVRPSGGSSLEEVGTWDSGQTSPHQDMVVWFGPLPLDMCKKLNALNGFTNDPPVIPGAQAWEFGQTQGGAKNWGTTLILLGAMAGHTSGCVNENTVAGGTQNLDQGYEFYHVLWAR